MENEFKNEAALLLIGLVSEFPGLTDDCQEVNGADLVDFISSAIANLSPDSRRFAAHCATE